MTTLPTLYKKGSTGKIQQWEIKTLPHTDGAFADIVVTHGQVDGKLQVTTDTIKEGKSKGKKNETTPLQQAEIEAEAKWEKQKKKGYVLSIEAAEAGEVDSESVQGGISPMLAHKYTEHGHKIKFPCYAQPKLDGQRCIAVISDGVVTLWTRTRKPITSVPHINKALAEKYQFTSTIFDGELYNHDFCDDFESLISATRKEEAGSNSEIIQYHIYDAPNRLDSFTTRAKDLAGIAKVFQDHPFIKIVKTVKCETVGDVRRLHDEFFGMGYEGLMLRNSDSSYENKRSYGLQKVKVFDDSEFPIVGIEEGRGKLQGHVAAFVCQMPDGQTFKAKLKGKIEALKQYFDDHSLWQGKKLTVKYQGLTNTNGVPRFPVGVAVRNYE